MISADRVPLPYQQGRTVDYLSRAGYLPAVRPVRGDRRGRTTAVARSADTPPVTRSLCVTVRFERRGTERGFRSDDRSGSVDTEWHGSITVNWRLAGSMDNDSARVALADQLVRDGRVTTSLEAGTHLGERSSLHAYVVSRRRRRLDVGLIGVRL